MKVSLYVYGVSDSYIASSIYVENIAYFASASDAVDDIESLSSDLIKKPLVIACSDEVSSIMDRRYNDLVSKCFFFNAGVSDRITTYMDKQRQLLLAKECGFSIPSSIDGLPNEINPDEVKYPCLVKPKASIEGGKNIAICYSSDELRNALAKFPQEYNVLVQDYLEKEYEIVILGLSSENTIVIPGFIQKHREERGGTTYSTVRKLSDIDNRIILACQNLIKRIGYRGLWGIECIKQGDKYFFIELNMRNDATTYAMKVAGVNLPYMYMKLTESLRCKPHLPSINSISAMVEFNDFNFVLKGKVGLFHWIREYKKSECKYFQSKEDTIPFRIMRREYLNFLKKRVLYLIRHK